MERSLTIEAHVVDLNGEAFKIQPRAWDLILMSFYLQRDLFQPAKQGLVPGGILIAIVHITEAGEEPTGHRLRPGELAKFFDDFDILSYREGQPADPEHRRISAEIVARHPFRGTLKP